MTEAFRQFAQERDMAIMRDDASFIFSRNGATYRRVDDDSALIKYKRVGSDKYRGSKRAKRAKRSKRSKRSKRR